MAGIKSKTVFVCQQCAAEVLKWQGQCPQCGAWNVLQEQRVAPPSALSLRSRDGGRHSALVSASSIVLLDEVVATETPRIPTGLSELDRVLGGGVVPGAVILLGGDPGIGKSTLLLQSLATLSVKDKNSISVLYVTGEESVEQVALRARRLGMAHLPIPLLAETQLEIILERVEQRRPTVVVIDSIQTMYTEALSSAPGSVAQVRECAAALTRVAKRYGISVILVGHVTKDGHLAGPRVLEHIVDTVLYFEGDSHSSFRLVRAIKNRFGAANELGVFAMTELGLKEVSNPSALFVSRHLQPVSGSVVTATLEGTRTLLVELQALTDDSQGGMPRRLSVGLESGRLALLLAVLNRHVGVSTAHADVFVNAVGGVKIAEPAADLALILAMYSSLTGRPLPPHLVVFGEVGLSGEVRPVQRGQERLREAAKLGFKQAILPALNVPSRKKNQGEHPSKETDRVKVRAVEGMEVIAVNRVEEACEWIKQH
jgi:DNA repair protein RadA/Sms